jgi:four helix bundle protein
VDSIAGNIAEGFGRFHKKDKQKFYYNARGSVMESIHWVQRATTRKLLSEKEHASILEKLEGLPREINYQIRLTEEKLRK